MPQTFFMELEPGAAQHARNVTGYPLPEKQLDGRNGVTTTHDKVDAVLQAIGLTIDTCEETGEDGLYKLKLKRRGRGRPRKFANVTVTGDPHAEEEEEEPAVPALPPPPDPQLRRKYIDACSATISRRRTRAQDAFTTTNNEIRRMQRDLVEKIRLAENTQREIQFLQNISPEAMEKYGLEYDRLVASPKITGVKIEYGVMHVLTDTLLCKDPRDEKIHEIGKFDIEIHIENSQIRWHNLTRQVNVGGRGRINAPHVNPDGGACLGSLNEILPELFAKYEFAALASMAIQFIENVNTDDNWGKDIDKFPVVKEKK